MIGNQKYYGDGCISSSFSRGKIVVARDKSHTRHSSRVSSLTHTSTLSKGTPWIFCSFSSPSVLPHFFTSCKNSFTFVCRLRRWAESGLALNRGRIRVLRITQKSLGVNIPHVCVVVGIVSDTVEQARRNASERLCVEKKRPQGMA